MTGITPSTYEAVIVIWPLVVSDVVSVLFNKSNVILASLNIKRTHYRWIFTKKDNAGNQYSDYWWWFDSSIKYKINQVEERY